MNILFFDTETNGKPINYKAPMAQVSNWPRVTQLAWSIYDDEGKLLYQRSFLIKPDGWKIPTEQFFIDNNMSTERCEAEGKPMVQVLDTFIDDIDLGSVDLLVAHNMDFDYNVLGAEMIRHQMKANRLLKRFCTMQQTTNICKIPGKYGFKWPTLQELHTFIFREPFVGAHDAMDDVNACSKCFFELRKQGHFQL